METHHLVNYFKQEGANSTLCKYVERSYQRLLDGHIVTKVEEQDFERLKENLLISDNQIDKPFILNESRFYFQRYFSYESKIVDFIIKRLKVNEIAFREREDQLIQFQDIIDKLFVPTSDVDWQKIGALNCFLNNFSIISGGPGTGKTRTVSRFLCLHYLINSNSRVALVAQTGKAAARLKESLDSQLSDIQCIMGLEFINNFKSIVASTIHRVLGRNRDSLGAVFNHNSNKTIPYDLVIIDEASMVDLPLMAKFMEAIDDKTDVIMLGDKNQLSSVEAGSVFGDLCDAFNLNGFSESKMSLFEKLGSILNTDEPQASKKSLLDVAVQFKKSYRFDSNKGIGKFSQHVLNQKLDESEYLKELEEETQGVQVEYDYGEGFNSKLQFFELLPQEERICEALKLLTKVKVLTAVKNGKRGFFELNRLIENHLESKSLIVCKEGFYHHQPIMITQNDYSLNLFNGDMGLVREESGDLFFFIEDSQEAVGYRKIPVGFIQNYQTVYAMTVHKSQGSEFEHVITVLPESSESQILNRELLYTAVTRAKHQALVIGTKDVIQATIEKKVKRVSGIKERLSI